MLLRLWAMLLGLWTVLLRASEACDVGVNLGALACIAVKALVLTRLWCALSAWMTGLPRVLIFGVFVLAHGVF